MVLGVQKIFKDLNLFNILIHLGKNVVFVKYPWVNLEISIWEYPYWLPSALKQIYESIYISILFVNLYIVTMYLGRRCCSSGRQICVFKDYVLPRKANLCHERLCCRETNLYLRRIRHTSKSVSQKITFCLGRQVCGEKTMLLFYYI